MGQTEGGITREAALRELRYARPNDQIAITKTHALTKLLTFKRSYVVPGAW